MSVLLKVSGGESVDSLMYVLCTVSGAAAAFMLLSCDIADYGVRFAAFLLSGGAFLLIFKRIGYINALSLDIEGGIPNCEKIRFFSVYFLIAAAAFALLAGAVTVLCGNNKKYCGYIGRIGKIHNRLSVFSIAAAFICIATASMIYG